MPALGERAAAADDDDDDVGSRHALPLPAAGARAAKNAGGHRLIHVWQGVRAGTGDVQGGGPADPEGRGKAPNLLARVIFWLESLPPGCRWLPTWTQTFKTT